MLKAVIKIWIWVMESYNVKKNKVSVCPKKVGLELRDWPIYYHSMMP